MNENETPTPVEVITDAGFNWHSWFNDDATEQILDALDDAGFTIERKPHVCLDCLANGVGGIWAVDDDPADCAAPNHARPLTAEVYETSDLWHEDGTPRPEYRWRVRHNSNGEIMASGEAYADPRDRDHAVEVLFPGVPVVEVEG